MSFLCQVVLIALSTGAPQSAGLRPYEHNPKGDVWPEYDKPTIPPKKYDHNPNGDTWADYDKTPRPPKKYKHNPKGDAWPAYDKPVMPHKEYDHNTKGLIHYRRRMI